MDTKKTAAQPKNKETDYFLKITAVQFLVCGFMVLLIFGVCRLSPDGGESIKAKYNDIMLTDISFSQVWSSVKEVATYVMKPIDVESVQNSVTQPDLSEGEPDAQPQEDFVETESESDKADSEESSENQSIAAVMNFFDESGDITIPAHGRISSYFGEREHPINGEDDIHNAIDIAVEEGSCVAAAWDGVVTETGYNQVSGNYVWLVHKNGNETFYCHLSEILVNDNAVIRAGETIAFSGNTGNSTGPHLHFAVKENGEFVDPLDYLKEKDGRI